MDPEATSAQWWLLVFGIVAMFITGLCLLVRIRRGEDARAPL